MIDLLFASSALHAQERRPTRGERLALAGSLTGAVGDTADGLGLGGLL